jgi:EF hand
MKNANKTLIGLVALGSALVMPMAFAQSETAPTATQDTTQSATPAEATPAEAAAPAAQAAPEAAAKQVTWADLDADKDGSISKTEATPLQSLSQVFDQADADANGKLTADEYKAYVAKNGNGGSDKQG